MKRLFYVRRGNQNKPHQLEGSGTSPYFETKAEAKSLRDAMNKGLNSPIFTIGRGPAHWRGQS